MKSIIRNAMFVAAGALVSVPLSVMGIAAADSSGDDGSSKAVVCVQDDAPAKAAKHVAVKAVAKQKQKQNTEVENSVNNSSSTTVSQSSTSTNTNGNIAESEGGFATGGNSQSQLGGFQLQGDPFAFGGDVIN